MLDETTQPTGEGMNQEEVEETSTNTSDEVETEDSEENAEPDYKLELERERKKAYELEQRLKKERSKRGRSDLSSPDVPVNENAIQEQVLKAQGVPQDLINVLKTISEDTGVDLITAQKDDYFLFRKEKLEREQRDAEAQLGASRGSSSGRPKKDFNSPGLSDEEHRKMFNKMIGR